MDNQNERTNLYALMVDGILSAGHEDADIHGMFATAIDKFLDEAETDREFGRWIIMGLIDQVDALLEVFGGLDRKERAEYMWEQRLAEVAIVAALETETPDE